MVVPTSEGDLLVVYGLDPFFIFPVKDYGFGKLLGEIQVDTDPRKRGVPLGLGLLCNLYKFTEYISYVLQGVYCLGINTL